MRIISGLFKGKKILQPKDLKTRPLKDLTKESIFNIINHSSKFKVYINEANILETILVGKCLGLDPYDQPAVELIKKETKKLLI